MPSRWPSSVYPHQHAAPPVPLHPDDLPPGVVFVHKGLPVLVETDACNFQHPPEAEARFFMASGDWFANSTSRIVTEVYCYVLALAGPIAVRCRSTRLRFAREIDCLVCE